MNPKLFKLSLIEEQKSFHLAFEKHFQIPRSFRANFGNAEALFYIRKAFLFEYAVTESENPADKIYYYFNALTFLNTLRSLQDINKATLTDKQNLFLCHTMAKIYYQLGVCWMQLDNHQATDLNAFEWYLQNTNKALSDDQIEFCSKTIMQCAIANFEQALNSYSSFAPLASLEENDDLKNRIYDTYSGMAIFDEYSPWARIISITYNYYLCIQEDELLAQQSKTIEERLFKLIIMHKDEPLSLSAQTIKQVETFLENMQEVSAPSPSSIPNATGFNDTSSTLKKRRLKKADAPEIDWFPQITCREMFHASFMTEKPWLIPAFLRPRQQADMDKIFQALPLHACPKIVTKPTGTGKTAEFSALAHAAWQKGLPTIIVVPTATLVEQTYQKLISYSAYDDMHFDAQHFAMFCPTKQHVSVGPITVVTQASYVAQAKKAETEFPTKEALDAYVAQHPRAYLQSKVVFHPDFFSLLIVDEGHHADGKVLLSIIGRPDCLRPKVLFSASTLPGQYPNLDAICHHLITQELKDAINSGELAPFQALTIDFSMYAEARELTRSIKQRMAHKSKDAGLDEESKKEISEMLCRNAGFGLTALSVLSQIAHQQPSAKQMMIFTDSIDHANQLAQLASIVFEEKVDAFHTQSLNRNAILEKFINNHSRAIVAVGALDEGFDVPNVNLILDFSIYKSKIRRMLQRLGRALRLREDGSGAILISIKVLSKDLQLIPRDEIIGHVEHGYLGLTADKVLAPENLSLTLPLPINLPSGEIIRPQGAALAYPIGRKRHKLGTPPESFEASQEEPLPPMQAPKLISADFYQGSQHFFATTNNAASYVTLNEKKPTLTKNEMPSYQGFFTDGTDNNDFGDLDDILDVEMLDALFGNN